MKNKSNEYNVVIYSGEHKIFTSFSFNESFLETKRKEIEELLTDLKNNQLSHMECRDENNNITFIPYTVLSSSRIILNRIENEKKE